MSRIDLNSFHQKYLLVLKIQILCLLHFFVNSILFIVTNQKSCNSLDSEHL